MKPYIYTKACAWMFIEALLKTAKCGSVVSGWAACDPATQWNATEQRRRRSDQHGTRATMWLDLLLRERSQTQRATSCVTPPIGHSGKGKMTGTENRLGTARDQGCWWGRGLSATKENCSVSRLRWGFHDSNHGRNSELHLKKCEFSLM